MVPPSQEQKARAPQAFVDAIASLGNHVEILQQELHAAQRVLHEYGLQLKAQEKQIQRLAVKNNQLNETPNSKTKPTQKSKRHLRKAAESQSSSSTQEADSDHIETEAQSLLEQKPQQKQIQQLAVENNQLNETPTSKTKRLPKRASDRRRKRLNRNPPHQLRRQIVTTLRPKLRVCWNKNRSKNRFNS